jgi:ABC-type Na+ efflux pump permease subunit
LRIHPGTVLVLLTREIRCALREKNIIVNSILIPLLLYPFMLWAVFTIISVVEARTSGLQFTVAAPAELRATALISGLMPNSSTLESPAGNPESLLAAGSVDAYVLPDSDSAGYCGRPPLRILFDGSREPGRLASQRTRDALVAERSSWLTRHLSSLGISGRMWSVYSVDMQNTASSLQMGVFVLGLIIPLTFIAMASVGCFYPAVDTFAGERERKTWETTLTTAASRMEILLAKFIHVALFGLSSAILNISAMVLSMSTLLGPILEKSGESVRFMIPPGALPYLALGAFLIAAFLSTGMVFFGAYARTYKEGQAMITPFYMMTIIPVVILQSPGLVFNAPMAAIPVVNVAMMFRQSLQGTPDPLSVLITICVTLLFSLAGLAASARLMGMENVLSPPDGAGKLRFLKWFARTRGKA